MSLNKLVEVLTPDNAPNLKSRNIFYGRNAKEKADLLWGVVYTRRVNGNSPSNSVAELVEVELVYEGADSHDFFLVRPTQEQIEYDSDLFAFPEIRVKLFASKDDYKKFFGLLLEHKLEDRISNELFMKAFDRIKELRNRLIPDSIAQAIQTYKQSLEDVQRKVIYEAKEELYKDPFLNLIW